MRNTACSTVEGKFVSLRSSERNWAMIRLATRPIITPRKAVRPAVRASETWTASTLVLIDVLDVVKLGGWNALVDATKRQRQRMNLMNGFMAFVAKSCTCREQWFWFDVFEIKILLFVRIPRKNFFILERHFFMVVSASCINAQFAHHGVSDINPRSRINLFLGQNSYQRMLCATLCRLISWVEGRTSVIADSNFMADVLLLFRDGEAKAFSWTERKEGRFWFRSDLFVCEPHDFNKTIRTTRHKPTTGSNNLLAVIVAVWKWCISFRVEDNGRLCLWKCVYLIDWVRPSAETSNNIFLCWSFVPEGQKTKQQNKTTTTHNITSIADHPTLRTVHRS